LAVKVHPGPVDLCRKKVKKRPHRQRKKDLDASLEKPEKEVL
jgi:hypothetical protein